ncbi:MAG TPA: DNA repair protein RecO [Candidatus Andersenbacteria bacterium]|nr:DNA repair protein RecO [Candidatus Andersenbacteria bacterium]
MPVSRIVSALVFSRKNTGEADRLVTFFTREEGLMRVIAKGVRKIPSARGGHLEPCTQVSVTINDSKAGIYAGKVETEEYFHALREDSDAFSRACGHIQLFHALFDTGQSAPEVFDALVAAWHAYPTLSFAKRIVMDASLALRIVQHAGLIPDMRLWNTNVPDDRSPAVIKYLAENPDHAVRLTLSKEDAMRLQRGMKDLLTRTIMVYS